MSAQAFAYTNEEKRERRQRVKGKISGEIIKEPHDEGRMQKRILGKKRKSEEEEE